MPRSNSFCASALQEVSKWTLPSLSSPNWAETGWANDMTANTVTIESGVLTMINLRFSQPRRNGFWADPGGPAIQFPQHCADFATKSKKCYILTTTSSESVST